jgi:hypothetical protein
MGKIDIKPTKRTPEVTLNETTNTLVFKGRSLPENTKQFYQPVKANLNTYKPEKGATVTIDIAFTYVSSSSLISLLSIFKQMKLTCERGCTLKINWFYEQYDDDLLSIGHDMEQLSGVEFKYIEVTV